MREILSRWLYFAMGVAAAAAAAWLVVGPEPPTPLNLALFLLLLVAATTGLLSPVMAWLHRRLPIGGRPPSHTAAVRQSFLIGAGLALAGWLQLIGLLDGTLVLGIVALVVLSEIFAQSRAH